MTDQHPITPPPELRRLWSQQAQRTIPCHDPLEWMQYVSEKAAQWGADQELEACRMEIIDGAGLAVIDETSDRVELADDLRNARRPKPPSLKDQACRLLECYGTSGVKLTADQCNTIRKALEDSNG